MSKYSAARTFADERLYKTLQLERISAKTSDCIYKDVSFHIKITPENGGHRYDEISLSLRTYLKALDIAQLFHT